MARNADFEAKTVSASVKNGIFTAEQSTPLHIAAAFGNTNVIKVRLLQPYQNNMKFFMKKTDPLWQLPFFQRLTNNIGVGIVILSIRFIHLHSCHCCSTWNGVMYSALALFLCVTMGQMVLQVLLDKGANVIARDFRGWTPLARASRNGRADATQVTYEE